MTTPVRLPRRCILRDPRHARGAQDFKSKVVGVTDGDTIEVMHFGRAERILLSGIDCPESGQAFGTVAEQMTSSLAFREEVTVKTSEKDR